MTKKNISQFEQEVIEGLGQNPKRLYSKYFYDAIGDKLFQDIMNMEEYYLTNSEFEIFSTQKEQILQSIYENEEPFQLIEFGAGDGLKTKLLLRHFVDKKVDFEYLPIDISRNALNKLSSNLKKEIPELKVSPQENTYFEALDSLEDKLKKGVLFLGGNIGNFLKDEAITFFKKANESLNKGDLFVIGIDLKKNPKTILDAYNDKSGITRAFNLNLLNRMNKELGTNFDVSRFDHYPISGATKSYLISQIKQDVFFPNSEKYYAFDSGEPIFMEISKKYDLAEIEKLANETGFEIKTNFFDCKHYFVDSVWIKK